MIKMRALLRLLLTCCRRVGMILEDEVTIYVFGGDAVVVVVIIFAWTVLMS